MMLMILFILAIVIGFTMLFWSANRLVDVTSTLAFRLGMPLVTIGVTVVAFGTSAPELVVSSVAAFYGSGAISIGNVVGSNIVNIGLILMVSGLIVPLVINERIVYRDLSILLVTTLLSALMLMDGSLSVIDGALFITGFFIYFLYLLKSSSGQESDPAIVVLPISKTRAFVESLILLITLLLASQILVWGAVGIARRLNVNELTIGLTLVAYGTSLPELATVLVCAKKGLHDMVLGAVIGSNIFNILAVLGLSGIVGQGIVVEASLLKVDIIVMVFITIIFSMLAYSSKASSKNFENKKGMLDGDVWVVPGYKCLVPLLIFLAYIIFLV